MEKNYTITTNIDQLKLHEGDELCVKGKAVGESSLYVCPKGKKASVRIYIDETDLKSIY